MARLVPQEWQNRANQHCMAQNKDLSQHQSLNLSPNGYLCFSNIRDQSKLTNLGNALEIHGPKLLGPAYKDPITSFRLFQKFTVEHPEVSTYYFHMLPDSFLF